MRSIADSYIEEGFLKGVAEGIEQGIEQGIERGVEKGIRKGKIEGVIQTALNMLKRGMDRRLVAEITDLSSEQISELLVVSD